MTILEPYAVVRPRAVPNTRWPHERAKTWLFLGVAQRCAGQPEAAADSLARAATIAARAGLRPLLGPAVEQLGLLDPDAAGQWSRQVAQTRDFLCRHAPPPT